MVYCCKAMEGEAECVHVKHYKSLQVTLHQELQYNSKIAALFFFS